MLALLAACVVPGSPPGAPAAGEAVDVQVPDVVEATLDCDRDAARWTLTLEVSGWAGRVQSWWSADGVYIEDHLVPSQAYAPDGTGQDFVLTLDISPDFRLVEEGDATALSCGADPSVRVVIDDVEGEVYSCVDFQPTLDWASVDGVPACPGD